MLHKITNLYFILFLALEYQILFKITCVFSWFKTKPKQAKKKFL